MTLNLPYQRTALAAILGAALLATGCASKVKLEDTPVESRDTSAAGTGTPPPPASQSGVATVDLNKSDLSASAVGKIVYFDFDSFVVKDEFRPVVEGNARALTANKQRRVVIEGHTDERGGREYNLALGQKRAEAVQKSLALLGVADGQMESISYGEERPAVQGSDESAWEKNRRVELKDR